MTLSHFDLIQWGLVILLEFGLFVLCSYRSIWKQAPAFFALVLFYLGNSLVLVYFALETSRRTYFNAYWCTEAITSVLILAACIELAMDVLRPGRLIPPGAFALLTNFSLATCAMLSGASSFQAFRAHNFLEAFIVLQKCTYLVACSLIFCTIFFSLVFSIRWRPRCKAIGYGVTLSVMVPFAFNTVEAYYPGLHWQQYWISNSAAFTASLLVWMAGVATPTRKVLWSDDNLEQMRDLLQEAAQSRRHLELMVG